MQVQYLAARHQQLHLIRTEKWFERRLRHHHVKTTLKCFELLKQVLRAYLQSTQRLMYPITSCLIILIIHLLLPILGITGALYYKLKKNRQAGYSRFKYSLQESTAGMVVYFSVCLFVCLFVIRSKILWFHRFKQWVIKAFISLTHIQNKTSTVRLTKAAPF